MLRQRVFVGALILSVVAWGTPARSADPPEIPLTIENHRFTPEAITVTAGTSFVLVITNKDATAEEFESHDLRIEKVIRRARPSASGCPRSRRARTTSSAISTKAPPRAGSSRSNAHGSHICRHTSRGLRGFACLSPSDGIHPERSALP